MDNLKGLNIIINDATLNIKIENERIIIKPLLDVESLEDYSFSMGINVSVEHFLNKVEVISKGVKNIIEKELIEVINSENKNHKLCSKCKSKLKNINADFVCSYCDEIGKCMNGYKDLSKCKKQVYECTKCNNIEII